jgi:hypothetical protein
MTWWNEAKLPFPMKASKMSIDWLKKIRWSLVQKLHIPNGIFTLKDSMQGTWSPPSRCST